MISRNRRAAGAMTAGLLAIVLLAGCSQSSGVGTHGARAEIYTSVGALVEDSSAIATVVIDSSDQTRSSAGSPLTVATATVIENVAAPSVGLDSREGALDTSLELNDVITIRQMGSPDTDQETPYLQPGETYLVFLASTGLPDVPDTEFYITGAVAGIYESDDDSASRGSAPQFERLGEDPDKLPEFLTTEEIAGL